MKTKLLKNNFPLDDPLKPRGNDKIYSCLDLYVELIKTRILKY